MLEKKHFKVGREKRPPQEAFSRNRPRDLLRFERRLLDRGMSRVAGVDEAGRGCLAGPVFAGAVILPPGLILAGVDDSKKLTPKKREDFFELIRRHAIAWAVASVDSEEIDRINIHRASIQAMKLAVAQLTPSPEYLLVDGRFPIPWGGPQQPIVKGDELSQTVAAASILAKVTRDRWIEEEGKKYPNFNFRDHKGYATEEHIVEIRKHGPTPLHRKSFRVELL